MFLSKDLSFTKTAERCYLSQSVLSRHIQALETELKCQLVIRDKQGVRLTPYGEAFAESCRAIDSAFASALANLDNIRRGFTETLRVAYVSPLPEGLLDRAYALQLERHPQTRLELNASWEDRAIMLLGQDRVDLSIHVAFEDPDPEVYESLSLYKDCYMVVMTSDHPLAQKDALSLKNLKGETLLVPSSRDFPAQYSRIISAIEQIKGMEVSATLNNRHDAIALPRAGKGLALVRGNVVAKSPMDGLVAVPLKDESLQFDVRAVWKKANLRQSLQDFLSILSGLVS